MRHFPTALAALVGVIPTTTPFPDPTSGKLEAWVRLAGLLLAITLHVLQARRLRRDRRVKFDRFHGRN